MIYFITFGTTHNYAESLVRIKMQAEYSGFFDKIIIYTEKDFDQTFLDSYSDLMKNNTGYGFWIWKSYFVKKTFDKMNDGDILVYADAGCSIVKNLESYKKFKIYINLVKQHESGSLAFQMCFPEETYTKSKTFIEFDLNNDEYRKSGQLVGTIFFLRKCPNTIKLVDEFYNYSTNVEIINNEFNKIEEIPTFIAHRNDQSIFSLLRKKHKSLLISDTTWYPNFNTPAALSNPILATRIRR